MLSKIYKSKRAKKKIYLKYGFKVRKEIIQIENHIFLSGIFKEYIFFEKRYKLF